MAMVMLGMFALNPVGIMGSIVQQLNHGISTGALFLLVGNVYERRHTRQISEYGGLSKVMPTYAAVFLIMTMSSIGLPALNGFIGELLILQGVFVANKIWAAFAASGVVLGAAYMLWLYQRTMFGKIENPKNEHLQDLNFREFATYAPLLILAVWIGLYPKPFIDRLQTSVDRVVVRINPEYRAPGSGFRQVRRHRDSARPRNRREPGSACRHQPQRFLLSAAGDRAHGGRAAAAARRSAGAARQAVDSRVGRRSPCSARRPWRSSRWPTRTFRCRKGLIAVDRFALFFKVIFLVSAALTVLMSVRYLDVEGTRAGEYYFLILCATLGMMFMAGGTDLITLFIGLETMAISFYILTGFLKPSRRSNEAAVKYFLLGAFSLGILLYGMSLMYGLSGTTNLRAIATGARRAGVAIRGWCSRSFSSWPAWGSRSPRCRSTCGRPTCTRARRRPITGVPVGRLEGRVVRDAAADLRREPADDARVARRERASRRHRLARDRLGHDVLRARRRDDDRRQFRRADAEQPEADAGVLVDRARRLPADWRRRGHGARRDRDARLPVRLRLHAARRLRGARADAPRTTSSATS